MRQNHLTETPKDETPSDELSFRPEEAFADPVAYLGLFGIEAELVEKTPTTLPAAA